MYMYVQPYIIFELLHCTAVQSVQYMQYTYVHVRDLQSLCRFDSSYTFPFISIRFYATLFDLFLWLSKLNFFTLLCEMSTKTKARAKRAAPEPAPAAQDAAPAAGDAAPAAGAAPGAAGA